MTTQTTREPGSGRFVRSPAMPAAEDGSQKRPSSRARSCQAARICSSETDTTSAAASASARCAGRRDPDRGGERLRAGGRLHGDDALLDAELLEAERVGARVAAAAVGQRQQVGRAAELLDELERGRLLALQAVRVERVDEDVRAATGQLERGFERLVEAAAHLEQPRSGGPSLRELAERDGALREQDDRA